MRSSFPSAAEEELVDVMSIDEYLIKNPQATFMYQMKGDAMLEAGILDGDMVLAERGKKPKPGSIVVIRVEGEEAKLEYFGTTKEPHIVEAVVIGIVRSYA